MRALKTTGLQLTAGALALMLFASESSAQPAARTEVVVVTVKTSGLYSSHARVKAGPVRILLENRTLLRSPGLQITRIAGPGGGANESVATNRPARSDRGNHSWWDAVLTPGSYRFSIAAAPNANIQLTVTP